MSPKAVLPGCIALLLLAGPAASYDSVPYETIEAIAKRNAQALWGDAELLHVTPLHSL